jgi:Mg/Co/Ni transporter MgtE
VPLNEVAGMSPVAAAVPKLDSGRASDIGSISGRDVESHLEERSEAPMVDTPAKDLREELEKNRRYAVAGPLRRALPERYIALLVTLLVEVPVALIISGGSESLREVVGSQRYELLMAFLPLTSAISGNVGLQASTLTTRAISHGDCHRGNFRSWLCTELNTSFILAALMGLALSALSLVWTTASLQAGVDVGFSLTVGISQAFSIAIAGLTGTCAPVLFSFVLGRDAGKWAGPLETAIQDIAGSFAMVYVAQALLISFIRVGLSSQSSTVPML